MRGITRRGWARLVLGAAGVPRGSRGGMRVLSQEPLITAQDFEQYPRIVTPVSDFYVRNHFRIPVIERTWKLRVDGLVGRPADFSLSDLRRHEQHHLLAVMECAGNGEAGAVGCAQWKGPRLSSLLEECRPNPRARWVQMTAADTGSEPDSGGEIPYSRAIPMEQARAGSTLLALEMNGQTLAPEHGAPCRAVVAGHYGMDSVKWIRRVELLEQPPNAFYMSRRFRRVRENRILEPVSLMRLKSTIVQPRARETTHGPEVEAGGFAWTGRGRIAGVEVRLDEQAWRSAHLRERPREFVWTAWTVRLEGLRPGVHQLAARAFSDSGERQTETRDPSRQDEYELNQYQRIRFFHRP